MPGQSPSTTGSSFKAGAFETRGKNVGRFSSCINFIAFWSCSYPNSSIKHAVAEVKAFCCMAQAKQGTPLIHSRKQFIT